MRSGRSLSPKEKYDLAYQHREYSRPEASIGYGLTGWVLENLRFKTVLDVGCGSGFSLLQFMDAGKKVKGTEISDTLLGGRLHSFRDLGYVKSAYAKALPFDMDEFDLVFCCEVMEHIPERDVRRSIGELIRVSRKYIFLTVCYREAKCFPELHLHETVREKEWWLSQINSFGGIKAKEVNVGRSGEDGGVYVIKKG